MPQARLVDEGLTSVEYMYTCGWLHYLWRNIVAKVPFFGPAVHAVLAVLRSYPKITDAELAYPENFAWVLQHGERQHLASALDGAFRFNTLCQRNIVAAWQVIANLFRRADEAWLELGTPNGRMPDMVLRFGDEVWVVDVKTSLHDMDRAISQTVGAILALKPLVGQDPPKVWRAGVLYLSPLLKDEGYWELIPLDMTRWEAA